MLLPALPPELIVCILHAVNSRDLFLSVRPASRALCSLANSVLRWRFNASVARGKLMVEILAPLRAWVGEEDRFASIVLRATDVKGSEARVSFEPAYQRILRLSQVTQSTVSLWTRGKSGLNSKPGDTFPSGSSRRLREAKDIYGTSSLYGSAFVYDSAVDYTGPRSNISEFIIAETHQIRGIPGFSLPIGDPVWLGLRITQLIDAAEDDYVLDPHRRSSIVFPADPPKECVDRSTQLPAFLELRAGYGRYVSSFMCPSSHEISEIVLEHTITPTRNRSPLQETGIWTGSSPIGSRLAQLIPTKLEIPLNVVVAKGLSGYREEEDRKKRYSRKVDVLARTLSSARLE